MAAAYDHGMGIGIPSVLRIPVFRRVWFASVASNGGTWLQAVAAGWLVWELTGSAVVVGALALAYRAPALLFSTWGGKIADRHDWRAVGIITFLVQALGALALAILFWTGHITVPVIFAATIVIGIGFAFGLPSVLALVPALVPVGRLQDAVALNAVGINVARMVGPMIGGVVLAFAGAAWCFLLNAVSFLALVIALALIPRLNQGSRVPKRPRAAVSYVVHDRAARRLLVGMSVFMLFAGPVQELAPVVVQRVGGGPVALGLLLGAMGTGALMGAWALTTLSGRGLPRHISISVATLGFGLALGVVAVSPWLGLTIAGMVVAGGFWIWLPTLTNAAIQMSSPSELLGRMLGFYQLSVIAPIAVGSVVFGWIAQRIGIGWSLGVATLCLVGWGAWTLFNPVPEIDRDIRTIRN